jgi:peptidoglycan/LPS O-acetylase OafA/YrhL
MDTRADRFPLFDSLRALAALAVVCSHTASFGGVVGEGDAARPFVGQFAVAVPIFLLISGFLLYRPFAAARVRRDELPSIKAYGWRRLLRIVPAYWVALVLITVWLGSNHVYPAGEPSPNVFSGEGLVAYFGFLQVYDTHWGGGGIPQAWTVDTEAVFYLLLPAYAALALWLLRRRFRTAAGELVLIGGVVALSVLYKLVVVEAKDMDAIPVGPLPLLSSLPAYADHFALGMGLAVLSVVVQASEREPGFVRVIDRHPWLPWLGAALAFVAVSKWIGMEGNPTERMSPSQYFARHALFGVVAFGLLLPAVFGDVRRGLVRRFMANRALLHVGMVSYGLYLWHLAIVIQLVRWDYGSVEILHPWVTWLLPTVLGGVLAGSLSYYLVERPALSFKRLVPERRGDQPGAVSAPAAPPSI